MTARPSLRHLASAFLTLALVPHLVHAQVPADAPRPAVTMRYKELTNREEFKFSIEGKGEFTKPVGDMNFDFPEGVAPSGGFDAALRTFCIEPLVPMFAGRLYDFAVGPINDPASYGLPDTLEGRTAAERRAVYTRELYGRYYADTVEDGKLSPAFQIALWEIATETQVPDGPLPFNLYTGSFKASYPNEAESPSSVQTAQRYLQSLTGDDAPFRDAKLLQGLELVRLDGLAGADGLLPQSQLALRPAPGDVAGLGGNGAAPAGGYGGFGPSAGPGGISPATGLGLPFSGLGGGSSPGVPGGGGLGGFGSGFIPFAGVGSPVTVVPETTSNQPGTSPAESTGTISTPPVIRPPELLPPVVTPPGTTNPPGDGEDPTKDPDPPTGTPIPAPPALALALVGIAGVWVARRRRVTLAA